jgi:hypothetical protein
VLRVLLLAFMFLALTGCWVGRDLYSPIDARPAIPAGVYRATGGDTPARVYRVSMLPDGMTQFDSGEKTEVYGFAPLGPGTFVGWVQIEDAAPGDDPNQLYGLVMRQADGLFMIYAPECKNEQAEIARKNGATIESGSSPACRFTTRAALEKAMRQMPHVTADALRLERIP